VEFAKKIKKINKMFESSITRSHLEDVEVVQNDLQQELFHRFFEAFIAVKHEDALKTQN
jgi:hypothetical protein